MHQEIEYTKTPLVSKQSLLEMQNFMLRNKDLISVYLKKLEDIPKEVINLLFKGLSIQDQTIKKEKKLTNYSLDFSDDENLHHEKNTEHLL